MKTKLPHDLQRAYLWHTFTDQNVTYSHTSNITCCNKSGNFCTIVTGCPEVNEMPYIGAVVLYLVLQRRAGVFLHCDPWYADRPVVM